MEAEFIAFQLENLPELRRSTKEDCDLSLLLLGNSFEDLIPIRPPSVCPRLQARDEVAFRLQK